MKEHGLADIVVKTEHKRMGKIFRGHPGFRKAKERWNDWAIFDWNEYKLPCEIWCFVDLSGLADDISFQIDEVNVEKGVYAVVECGVPIPEYAGEDADLYETKSELFQPFLKEVALKDDGTMDKRTFYLADTEAILAPACVVPDVGSDFIARYFLLTPRYEWANIFKTWLDQPHKLDDMTEEIDG